MAFEERVGDVESGGGAATITTTASDTSRSTTAGQARDDGLRRAIIRIYCLKPRFVKSQVSFSCAEEVRGQGLGGGADGEDEWWGEGRGGWIETGVFRVGAGGERGVG